MFATLLAAIWITSGVETPKHPECFADNPAPVFRRTFSLPQKATKATLEIAGVGAWRLYVNSSELDAEAMHPAWVDYDLQMPRSSFDVTALLKRGDNQLRVDLGNGRWNPLPLLMWGHVDLTRRLHVGEPCFRAELKIKLADGTEQKLETDESWQWAEGPLLRNDLYLGEKYDARREIGPDTQWRPAVAAKRAPKGKLVDDVAAPRRFGVDRVVAATKLANGEILLDFGNCLTGRFEFTPAAGAAGDELLFRFGDLVHPDGTINTFTTCCGQIKGSRTRQLPGAPRYAEQTETYIFRGGERTPHLTSFAWHTFRYVQVKGWKGTLDELKSATRHNYASVVPGEDSFHCDVKLFNDIHEITRRTFLGNLMGVQSDCPGRERFGYGGDIVSSAEAFCDNFDMSVFYAKVVRDFIDAQTPDGFFTETAPNTRVGDGGMGCGSGPLGWSYAVPCLMDVLWRWYGDEATCRFAYPALARCVRAINKRFPGVKGAHCLGDHEAYGGHRADGNFVGVAFYYGHAVMAARFAKRFGLADDEREFNALAAKIKDYFQKHHIRPNKVVGNGGWQGEFAIAMHFGLTPPEDHAKTKSWFIGRVKADNYKPTGGIFGAAWLPIILSEDGEEELVGKWATSPGCPGWAFMLEKGATTLWEHWAEDRNTFSWCHPMFGSIDDWFVRDVVGVRPADDAFGCDKVVVAPHAPSFVKEARGALKTPKGMVRVAWKRGADGKPVLDVKLPAGVVRQ